MTLHATSKSISAVFHSSSGLLPRLHSALSSRNGSFAFPKPGNAANSFIVLTDRDSYERYSANFEPADLHITPAEASSPASSICSKLVRVGSQALPLSPASYAQSFTDPKSVPNTDDQQQHQRHQQQDDLALDFDSAAQQPGWDVIPSWSFHQPAQHGSSTNSSSSCRPGMKQARQLYAEHQLRQLAELRREFGSQPQQQQQQQEVQQQVKGKKIGKLLTNKLSSM
jgi:hypothetical protein